MNTLLREDSYARCPEPEDLPVDFMPVLARWDTGRYVCDFELMVLDNCGSARGSATLDVAS